MSETGEKGKPKEKGGISTQTGRNTRVNKPTRDKRGEGSSHGLMVRNTRETSWITCLTEKGQCSWRMVDDTRGSGETTL